MIRVWFSTEEGMDTLLGKMMDLIKTNMTLEKQVVDQLREINDLNSKCIALNQELNALIEVIKVQSHDNSTSG